jgi:uncharacterized RDD family membrane protein YckC
VLGPRIAAALIDSGLLAGLALILGLTAGESRVGEGRFTIVLSEGRLLLFVALALLYYFAFEVTTGQTVGKRLLGVRVVSLNWGRPSVWAIAARTAFRIVDVLPFAYLIGMIAVLATGTRRQRIGDLVAETAIERALPVRRRGLALAPLVLVLLAVVGLVVYRVGSDGDTRTYRGHGVSFDYPGGWREVETRSGESRGNGEMLWRAAVSGENPLDFVGVVAFRLTAPVPEDVDAISTEVEQGIRGRFERRGGALEAGPEPTTVGGMAGFRFRGTYTVDGSPVEDTIILVFDGTAEFQFECLHPAASAAEVGRGCDQVLRTFTVTTPGPSSAASTTPAPTTPERTTPAPTPTGPGPLTAQERAWLAAIPTYMKKIGDAFAPDNVYLTPRKLREWATLFRGCRRDLARGLPSTRLRPVYALVRKGCAEYDKGATCFVAAARIDAPARGSAADRAQNRALDCGFAAQGKGVESLADAANEGERIRMAAD